MIDALIKRVSVTYKCYEMYAHRGKIVQLLVFNYIGYLNYMSDILKLIKSIGLYRKHAISSPVTTLEFYRSLIYGLIYSQTSVNLNILFTKRNA
jgi:hypothetical protein